jgi:hypothetical protein
MWFIEKALDDNHASCQCDRVQRLAPASLSDSYRSF